MTMLWLSMAFALGVVVGIALTVLVLIALTSHDSTEAVDG